MGKRGELRGGGRSFEEDGGEKSPSLCQRVHPSPLQFEELQVGKFLVSMEASGLPFTLLLNKADLVPEQEVQRRLQQVWRGQGYEGHKQRTYSFSLSVTPTIR